MKKAIIFDLWNTLTYKEGTWASERLRVLLGLSQDGYFSKYEKAAMTELWPDVRSACEALCQAFSVGANEELLTEMVSIYEDGIKDTIYLFDDVGVLPKLREAGLKLGLITNAVSFLSDRGLEMVRYLGSIDVISTSFECQCVKPDARIFEKNAASLGISPSECFFVGDTHESDVEGALRAGLDPIWLRRDGTRATDCAVPQITSLWELMESPFQEMYPINSPSC